MFSHKRPAAQLASAEEPQLKVPSKHGPCQALVCPRWNEDGNKGESIRVQDLETPSYVLYRSIFEQNVSEMQARAKKLGCQLRPHMKTHKTLEGGLVATNGTKRCIVVSTLAEAEFFANGGFDDILYAVPICASKLPRAARLVQQLERFHIAIDHPDTLTQVLNRPPADGKRWSIFLMVDCGYGRDGVDPTGDLALEIAKRIRDSAHAELYGLYTHGGHSYDAESQPDAVARIHAAGRQEAAAIATLNKRIVETLGLKVPSLGVGSTPTCSRPPPEGFPGINEMHPGNFCYYDVMQEKIGACSESDIAVRVITRVIGHYPARNLILVDLGWTGCSKQGEACHYGRIEGHPELVIGGLKQEAGLLKSVGDSKLDFTKYPLGMVLRVEPYHSCAHTKQHDRIHVLKEDKETVAEVWAICHGW